MAKTDYYFPSEHSRASTNAKCYGKLTQRVSEGGVGYICFIKALLFVVMSKILFNFNVNARSTDNILSIVGILWSLHAVLLFFNWWQLLITFYFFLIPTMCTKCFAYLTNCSSHAHTKISMYIFTVFIGNKIKWYICRLIGVFYLKLALIIHSINYIKVTAY